MEYVSLGGRCADHSTPHPTLGAFKNAPPTIHGMFIYFMGDILMLST